MAQVNRGKNEKAPKAQPTTCAQRFRNRAFQRPRRLVGFTCVPTIGDRNLPMSAVGLTSIGTPLRAMLRTPTVFSEFAYTSTV